MINNNKAMDNIKHPYWGRLASTTVQYVDHLTNSHDMIVEILPDTRPKEAKALVDIVPAYYSPSDRKIFIDASTAFADELSDISQYDINISVKSDRNDYPLFAGMLAHEIGHEKHTRYSFSGTDYHGNPVTSLEMEIVKVLEEPRMEKRLMDEHPDPACYLSSVVHHIILKSLFEKFVLGIFGKNEALTLFLLVKSRLLLGIIPASFLPPDLGKKMNDILGENNVIQMSSIIKNSLALTGDDCFVHMVNVARKVIEIFELRDEHPENPCHSHQDSSSEPQTGQSDNSSSSPSEAGRGDSTASGDSEKSGENESGDSGEGNKEQQKTNSSPQLSESQKKELEEALNKAQQGINDHQEKVRKGETNDETMEDSDSDHLQDFEEVTQKEKEKHLTTIGSPGNTYEPPIPLTRDAVPNYQDKFNAQMLYRDIRKAQHRADDMTITPVGEPRGKMVMRKAMRRSVQRDMGLEITAKPWNKFTYEEITNPPLLMGVAMDVSASLEKYIPSFMHYMWSLNEAVLMNKGMVHNVLWGKEHVTFEHHRKIVQVPLSAFSGQSQGLPNALRKLAYNCNFHHAQGAKVAFVITDSQLPNIDDIVRELRMLNSLDVKVIWISTTEDNRHVFSKYANYIYMDNPNKFYEIMSPQVVEALENPMLTTVI